MTAWLKLEPDHVAEADRLAHARQAAAEENEREAYNNAPTDYAAALHIHTVGTRCEKAGQVYFNPVVWHDFAAQLGGLPDLHDFIDVKGRQGEFDDLIVQKDKTRPDWAYVAIYCHKHPWYELHGWMWGRELTQKKWWRDPTGKRPAFFVPKKEVARPMSALFDELRRRQ